MEESEVENNSLKIIFLDVDGVLNIGTTQGHFEPNLLKNLKSIILQTNAKIVLSSTWKYKDTMVEVLVDTFVKEGILKERKFFSQTPDLRRSGPSYPRENSHATRAHEILTWIKVNNRSHSTLYTEDGFPLPKKEVDIRKKEYSAEFNGPNGEWLLEEQIEINNFVIIDDLNILHDGCFGHKLESHFVKTNMETGLGEKEAKKAIEILRKQDFRFIDWAKQVFTKCDNPNCLLKQNSEPEKRRESDPNNNSNTTSSNNNQQPQPTEPQTSSRKFLNFFFSSKKT